mmetsp:Transcript_89064/g.154460  ORF Transcript_89064/g.154460 Transcript_89064/m.154460 type:complete len:201 (+) Transcript_89064:204-806(+)
MYLTLTFHPFPTLASSFAPRSHVAPHEELIVVYVCLCVALQRELTCRTVRNVDARLVFQVHDFSDPNTPHQKSFLVTSVFFRSRRTILLGHGTLQFALFVSCLSLAREFWIPASCGGYSSNSSRVRERMPLVAISLPPYPLLFPLLGTLSFAVLWYFHPSVPPHVPLITIFSLRERVPAPGFLHFPNSALRFRFPPRGGL